MTIASNVPAGSYPITITASNGVLPNATQIFTLTVTPSSGKLIVNLLSVTKLVIGTSTVTAEVGNAVSSLDLAANLQVSANATFKVFSDAACTAEIASKIMSPLAMGANTVYVQVTAEDGTVAVYTLTITRVLKIFPDGPIKLTRKQQHNVFKDAINAYGGPLTFVTTGKIKVDCKGYITYKFCGICNTTVTAYDAITGAVVDTLQVKVVWNWWQWILVIIGFGWLYL